MDVEQAPPAPARPETAGRREAIETAALELLDSEGPDAVTTRAVSAKAGVRPMTIYRLFGDMDELVRAATARGFDRYIAAKHDLPPTDDPVDALRAGWDLHVGYGLDHPQVYAVAYGRYTPGVPQPALDAAARILRTLVERVTEAGRLTQDVDRAAQVIHSAGCGVTLTLMALPADQRDMSVSVTCREAVLAAVTTGATPQSGRDVARHAVALSRLLPDDATFSPGERLLLDEWLARLS